MNVQEFLGDIQVDGAVSAEGTVTAADVSTSGNVSAANISVSGRITTESLRIGTPNRIYSGERDLNLTTVGAGTIVFIGCTGTVNATGTGAKTLYLIGCPSLTVNNNGSAKTYRDGFPVGGIFQTTGEDSPAEMFGGNWERYAAGKVLVGIDTTDTDFNEIGKTGGEKKHRQTLEELVNHQHYDNGGSTLDFSVGSLYNYGISKDLGYGHYVGDMGGGKPFNVMQPYTVVNIWRRINVSGQE